MQSNCCLVCGKPATRNVDGEPSCDEHINLIYEHQLEDYTSEHLKNNDWVETTNAQAVAED